MAHDYDAVCRETHIQLETIGSGGQPAIERSDCVFRTERAAAAMCEHPRAACPPEERHNAQCSMLTGQ
jgi:hypothetical protein